MPTPGYVFRDSGTTPSVELENPIGTTKAPPSSLIQKSSGLSPSAKSPFQEKPTHSHTLATIDQETKGAAQHAGKEDGITNLGWQANGKGVATLVGGLTNDDFWTLIRRFNKQIYHVRVIPEAPPGGLDLNIASEEEFSPDKLRANIERLYMTVLIGMIGFGKHIARLRSWRETRRTAAFCTGYFLAWLLNCLVPISVATLIILITVPQSREILFPPAPIALVDSKTGGVQTPKAGVLGSHDSATGAPEKHKGEAVEQEASNLVSGLTSMAIASAAGKHEQGQPPESNDDAMPDPTRIGAAAAGSRDSATGGTESHDKTKQPMEAAVWEKMRPAMGGIATVCDTWEIFANALSPTPPFSHTKQYQLGAILAPVLLVSLFVNSKLVMSSTTFIVGAAFFSDPLIQRGIVLLNEKIPDWPKYLELRNTLLMGVPTNAQLTLTLLRIGEANRAPLPPPPKSNEAPSDQPAEINKEQITGGGLDASHEEIEDAINVSDPPSGGGQATTPPKKKGFGARINSLFKTTTAAAVETKLAADQVRAVAGSHHARHHLGILENKKTIKKKSVEGPVEFLGRYKGQKGAMYIDSNTSPPLGNRPASPAVYFTTHLDGDEAIESMPKDPSWAVPIADIIELKKLGGLGWKAKLIVGWATEREIKEQLQIVTRTGEHYRITAMKERDEAFNRLIAIPPTVWESM